MLLYEHGVGYHRAGISWEERGIVEQMFIDGVLPILTCTSTLSLGVNLPAHLVVIKGTQQFLRGQYREYDESTILQMAGRAGRVQFGDKEATVAIMTNYEMKSHYETLMDGGGNVESCLHHHLYEHLNTEIVLRTITSIKQSKECALSIPGTVQLCAACY